MIYIIDYGMGNLHSIGKAFEYLGERVKYVDSVFSLKKADRIILPGVGSFGKAVSNLKKKGLWAPLKEKILIKKVSFLGICLGLQLLFEKSMESPSCKGLSIFKGILRKFKKNMIVPHMGWNRVNFIRRNENLFKGIEDGSFFYFCHSYYAPLTSFTVGTTLYGVEFSSIIVKENIVLVQFHPEKSQKTGLKILRNFLKR